MRACALHRMIFSLLPWASELEATVLGLYPLRLYLYWKIFLTVRTASCLRVNHTLAERTGFLISLTEEYEKPTYRTKEESKKETEPRLSLFGSYRSSDKSTYDHKQYEHGIVVSA